MTSIIIPNYFSGIGGRIIPDSDEALWFAQHCIERIKRFTTDYELILIDNGSVVGKDFLDKEVELTLTLQKIEPDLWQVQKWHRLRFYIN